LKGIISLFHFSQLQKIQIKLLPVCIFLLLITGSCKNDEKNDPIVIKPAIVKDADGNKYSSVKIGTQEWMVENLRTTKYNDGTLIPFLSNDDDWKSASTGAFCIYDSTVVVSDQATYGYLYNWYAVNSDKLCPAGWHVPTTNDWNTLVNHLGGEGTAGGKMKKAGTSYWRSPNLGASNESGFTAIPGGCRWGTNGIFESLQILGNYWVAEDKDSYYAYLFRMEYNTNTASVAGYGTKKNGFSVRCMKD